MSPIRRIGVRPGILLMGCDRELFIALSMICLFPISQILRLDIFILSILFWGIGIFLLRRLAKHDPLAFHVYRRHMLYSQRRYEAHSTPFKSQSYRQKEQLRWK